LTVAVAVVGVLTVTVQAGSLDQPPQVVGVLVLSGSTLQVPQVVLVGSALTALTVGSALQVPQVVEELVEWVLTALTVGSAVQLLQLPVPPTAKPLVAELHVELVQVPKPLPKLWVLPARASAPRLKATVVVSFMLIIGNTLSEKGMAGVNVLPDRNKRGW
jgi:hypothetical protein